MANFQGALYLRNVNGINNTYGELKDFDNFSRIFRAIQKHILLEEKEREYVRSVFSYKELQSKEILLRQGVICSKLFFVESGIVRAYNLTEGGKEATIMFAVQDWWITDMNAFINQKSSLMTLETLEDSRIFELNFKDFEPMLKTYPKFERFFRILFQNAYVREQLRVLDSISQPTEKRYRRFVKKYPQIVEKVTQKQIASYLGVTPEFLSSIKKNNQS